MKSIPREKQVEFYNREINALLQDYEIYFKTNVSELRNLKEFFVGLFMGIDPKRGSVLIKFRKSTAPPLHIPLLALKLSDKTTEIVLHDKVTFEKVREQAEITSDALPIFYIASEDQEFSTIGFNQIDLTFAKTLSLKQYIFFGRKEPPIQYYINLINATKNFGPNTLSGKILDNIYEEKDFSPLNIDDSDFLKQKILEDLEKEDMVIIQGPPGTGKTTLLSELCHNLLEKKNSLIVSSLTNRALMELAKKDKLKKFLGLQKIYKTNLTTEEEKECEGILHTDTILPSNGSLMLTTYYKMSGLISNTDQNNLFDYIILEEASQAFLGTIACARALAKRLIIVGDHLQLPPVVTQKNPQYVNNNIDWVIYGLKYFGTTADCSKIRLTSSYRLLPKAVQETGIFYDNSLKSKAYHHIPSKNFPNLNSSFNKNGGTSVYFDKIRHEGKTPKSMIPFILNLIKDLKKDDPKVEIAVLSPFRATRSFLQDNIYPNLDTPEGVIIETIDRIQGLTCDFSIFIIPFENPSFCFNLNRFNVATSRARYCTLIITDELFHDINPASGLVSQYWNKIINSNFRKN